jgi:hypothetical protein
MWKWAIFAALLVAHVALCALEGTTNMSALQALCVVAAFLWGWYADAAAPGRKQVARELRLPVRAVVAATDAPTRPNREVPQRSGWPGWRCSTYSATALPISLPSS